MDLGPPAYLADFVVSAAGANQFPPPLDFEAAVLGRSNSGKSSLLNRWLGRKALARVSKTPGRTRLVNFFKVAFRKDSPPFYAVDLPGYGFAAAPKTEVASWEKLVGDYLTAPRGRRIALILMDIRRDAQAEEQNLSQWLKSLGLPFRVIASKCDKLSPTARNKRLKVLREELALTDPPLAFSAINGTGRLELIQLVEAAAGSFRSE
jgi:GTP-binding protein